MLGFEKERYGSLDGLDVIDGLDIPLFLNSLDIFAESALFLSLFMANKYNLLMYSFTSVQRKSCQIALD